MKKTLNIEQVVTLIEAAKEPPIYMEVLFAAMMGLRRSEINGLKYSDIDYMISQILKLFLLMTVPQTISTEH